MESAKSPKACKDSPLEGVLSVIVSNAQEVDVLALIKAFASDSLPKSPFGSPEVAREYRRCFYRTPLYIERSLGVQPSLDGSWCKHTEGMIKTLTLMLEAVFRLPVEMCRGVLDDLHVYRDECTKEPASRCSDHDFPWARSHRLPDFALFINACSCLVDAREALAIAANPSVGAKAFFESFFGNKASLPDILRSVASRSFLLAYLPSYELALYSNACEMENYDQKYFAYQRALRGHVADHFSKGTPLTEPVCMETICHTQKDIFLENLVVEVTFPGVWSVSYVGKLATPFPLPDGLPSARVHTMGFTFHINNPANAVNGLNLGAALLRMSLFGKEIPVVSRAVVSGNTIFFETLELTPGNPAVVIIFSSSSNSTDGQTACIAFPYYAYSDGMSSEPSGELVRFCVSRV